VAVDYRMMSYAKLRCPPKHSYLCRTDGQLAVFYTAWRNLHAGAEMNEYVAGLAGTHPSIREIGPQVRFLRRLNSASVGGSIWKLPVLIWPSRTYLFTVTPEPDTLEPTSFSAPGEMLSTNNLFPAPSTTGRSRDGSRRPDHV
jgi:hypothetical protein